MPRDLDQNKNNLAVFTDGVSGSDIGVYYCTPTNGQRIKFRAACITKANGKVKDTSTEAQLVYGSRILTGIRDGDFVHNGGKPLSSDEKSPDFDPDWKKIVIKSAGDIIQALALIAFSGVIMKLEDVVSEEPDDDAVDMSEIPGLEDTASEPDVTEEDEKESPLG